MDLKKEYKIIEKYLGKRANEIKIDEDYFKITKVKKYTKEEKYKMDWLMNDILKYDDIQYVEEAKLEELYPSHNRPRLIKHKYFRPKLSKSGRKPKNLYPLCLLLNDYIYIKLKEKLRIIK